MFRILDKVVNLHHPNELTIIADLGGGRYTVSDGITSLDLLGTELIHVRDSHVRNRHELLKMYVVVDSSAPIGLGINGAVHAAYAAGSIVNENSLANDCIKYGEVFNREMTEEWIAESYRNVTALGNSRDIGIAIAQCIANKIPYFAFYEPDWADAEGRPLAVAFGPHYGWPEVFQNFELHGGTARPHSGHRRK